MRLNDPFVACHVRRRLEVLIVSALLIFSGIVVGSFFRRPSRGI